MNVRLIATIFRKGCVWLATVSSIYWATFAPTTNAEDVPIPPVVGRETVPQRIITIAPNAAEIICTLGACERIVGVSKFCVFPEELKGRPRIGGLFDPDLEKIIALRPDLVVLRGRSESVEELCRESGIRLYLDPTETLSDIETCIRELGQRLGRPEQAREETQRLRESLDTIRRRVADQEPTRVFVAVSRRPGDLANVLTTGKGTFLNEMVEIAGGQNVFASVDMAWPQVSAEAIVARRPEVIIELQPELELTDDLRRRMLSEWKTLGPVPAVQNDRVHFLTDDHALIPSPRCVEIIEKLSWILHPDQKSDRE